MKLKMFNGFLFDLKYYSKIFDTNKILLKCCNDWMIIPLKYIYFLTKIVKKCILPISMPCSVIYIHCATLEKRLLLRWLRQLAMPPWSQFAAVHQYAKLRTSSLSKATTTSTSPSLATSSQMARHREPTRMADGCGCGLVALCTPCQICCSSRPQLIGPRGAGRGRAVAVEELKWLHVLLLKKICA